MSERDQGPLPAAGEPVVLRPVARDGALADLLDRRRSTREFAPATLGLDDLASLLWSAYGGRDGAGRSVPSAHGLYPLTVTVIAGEVESLLPGAYRYDPASHQLLRAAAGDHRRSVADTTLADSGWLPSAPVLILLGADVSKVNAHFAEQPPRGRRGERYVWLEAGHASQNLYLAATERHLGAVLVAGFDDELLGALMTELGCGDATVGPVAVVAIGRPLRY